MKVAITCDYLLERTHYVEIIENLCEVFPEASIYCFAHKKGAILGHIEMRSIKSTYLSNIVKNEEEFYEHSNKLPSLAKNLFVSCDYDLIINVSKGFSQGFKKCEKTKLITYLYDLDIERKIKNTLLQKIFFPFVKSWIKNTLNSAELVLSSRAELLHVVGEITTKTEIMPPPFRVSDYALFPKTMFKHDFFLIESQGLNIKNAQDIISWMREWHYKFQFVGPDEHLAELKKDCPESAFFGNRCSGEHASVMAASRAFISFNTEDFPAMALGSLATGRPVILQATLKKWLEGNGVSFINTLSKNEFKIALDSVITEEEIDGQKLRANVMEYHDIKFRAQMKRTLDKVYHDIHKREHSHPADCSQCN